ncbi:MAG: hypothetical protein IIZ39_13390 [Blautia sp.]|nr:hypothetical protein [Blautia sp.]
MGKKKRRLASGMVRVILTCMIIPYVVLSGALLFTYRIWNEQQIGDTVKESLDSAGIIAMDNLYGVIEDSRQASYDGRIKKSYEVFLQDGDEDVMYREVSSYLSQTYKFSKSVRYAVLLYKRSMTREYYTYSNAAGATYALVQDFFGSAAGTLRQMAEDLDTRALFVGIGGQLYLVRNMVRSNYDPFAVLVLGLNPERLFERMDRVLYSQGSVAILGEEVLWKSEGAEEEQKDQGGEKAGRVGEVGREERGEGESGEEKGGRVGREEDRVGKVEKEERYMSLLASDPVRGLRPREGSSAIFYDRKQGAAVLSEKVNGQIFTFEHFLDKGLMFSGQATLLGAYLVMLLTLVPFLIATFHFFYLNFLDFCTKSHM